MKWTEPTSMYNSLKVITINELLGTDCLYGKCSSVSLPYVLISSA
jgi:hypothetical protein